MDPKITPGIPRHSVGYFLMIGILLVAFFFIAFSSISSYIEAKDSLLQKNVELQEQTENNLISSTILLDRGLELFDMTFDRQLERMLAEFSDEYEHQGRRAETIDLNSLKTRFGSELGGEIDLYIINDDGVIEFTTDETDLGLDFKQWPEAFDQLTRVREGDSFSSDRSSFGEAKDLKSLRKFAYLPTPDHRYVLEIGFVSTKFKDIRKEFSYKGLCEECVTSNPNLLYIRYFDQTGRCFGAGVRTEDLPDDSEPSETEIGIVDGVFESHNTYEVENEANETLTRYVFIDLPEGDYVSSSMMDVVAQLTYSTNAQQQELQGLYFSHLFISLIAILMALFIAFAISRFVSTPLRGMVQDINQIAEGDLGHKIREVKGQEFEILQRSINLMVARLTESIGKLRDSEVVIKKYSENLEEMVEYRTEELLKANKEANLYLDIISHDLNTSDNTVLSYLEHLHTSLTGSDLMFTDKAIASTRKSLDIVRYVNVLRRMFDQEPYLIAQGLDTAVGAAIETFPDTDIHYERTGFTVLADEMLPEIFDAVISWLLDYAGNDISMGVRVLDAGDKAQIAISHTGKGFTEEMIHLMGSGIRTGKRAESRVDLRLYIAQSLVTRYNGQIWAEDRIEGKPEQGPAIIFTLRRRI